MSEISPYWQSADKAITVYHAPFEDVLEAGLVPVEEVALIHDDPHYGVRERTARISAKRGLVGGEPKVIRDAGGGAARGRPKNHDFPAVVGDDRPFDPRPIIDLQRPTVIWGGHLCEPALPRVTSWLFWDKREDTTPDDNGDGEQAWSNLGGPIRRFSHLWRGTCRASETGVLHLHGTQKPVALSLWVFEARAKLQRGALVFVPHGGSGPDLPAARAMGLRLIWCDVERWCCDTAVARLPEAPAHILERAKAFQRSTRLAHKDTPIGPLFSGGLP